jgi:pilus assembly protein CpaB
MSIRLIILLFLALVAAGGTAMMAKNWVASERAQILSSVPAISNSKSDMIEVLVAKTDLIPGSFVLKEKLDWQEWPEDALNDHMLKKGAVEIDDFIGSVVRARIPAGQPVLPSSMVLPGDHSFLAAVLAPGMRAVTVPLNVTSGLGGFVFPGDKVDLLLSIVIKPENDKSEMQRDFYFTETLLKNVRVIGKDQSAVQIEGEVKVAKSATLEVTPKQAETVALATMVGQLSLSLRSLGEEDVILSELSSQNSDTGKALDHKVSFVDAAEKQPVQRLEIQEELSMTTDLDVNFAYRKALSLIGKPTQSTGRKVQVLRGSQSDTKNFN